MYFECHNLYSNWFHVQHVASFILVFTGATRMYFIVSAISSLYLIRLISCVPQMFQMRYFSSRGRKIWSTRRPMFKNFKWPFILFWFQDSCVAIALIGTSPGFANVTKMAVFATHIVIRVAPVKTKMNEAECCTWNELEENCGIQNTFTLEFGHAKIGLLP